VFHRFLHPGHPIEIPETSWRYHRSVDSPDNHAAFLQREQDLYGKWKSQVGVSRIAQTEYKTSDDNTINRLLLEIVVPTAYISDKKIALTAGHFSEKGRSTSRGVSVDASPEGKIRLVSFMNTNVSNLPQAVKLAVLEEFDRFTNIILAANTQNLSSSNDSTAAR
jgi:hypothetical protein